MQSHANRQFSLYTFLFGCLRCCWISSQYVPFLLLSNPASFPPSHRYWALINILHPKLCLSINFQRSQLITLILLSVFCHYLQCHAFPTWKLALCRLFPKALKKKKQTKKTPTTLTFKFTVLLHIQKAYFECQKLYTRSFCLHFCMTI